MKKIRFDDCICKSRIKEHNIIKDELLSLMEQSPSETLDELRKDSVHIDHISKLDWNSSYDISRPWAQKFINHWQIYIREIVQSMGYMGVDVHQCWYQQYQESDIHGWHIHGAHFTGVYYLEFPPKSARTEICSPYSGKIKKLNVKEGDFVIFPSHWIHRAPSNKSKRKTIISWNFNVITENLRMDLIKGGKPYIFF